MIYLFWYLGVGAAVLIAVFMQDLLQHRLNAKYSSTDTTKPWQEMIVDKLIIPIVLAIAIPCAWPIVIYIWIKDHRANKVTEQRVNQSIKDNERLTVNKIDLLSRMSIAEIENLEHVTDPLGAVPDLPFGHLNPAWEKLKGNLIADDEIWTFNATWNKWNDKRLCQGYAILRGEEVPHHCMTGCNEI
jgi:hypothetical protein